jgi:hypothetical protein
MRRASVLSGLVLTAVAVALLAVAIDAARDLASSISPGTSASALPGAYRPFDLGVASIKSGTARLCSGVARLMGPLGDRARRADVALARRL